MLMNQLFDLYEAECIPHLQWRSQRDYRSIVIILRRVFGHKQVVDVRPKDVAEFINVPTGRVHRNRMVTILSTQSRFSAESSRASNCAIYSVSPSFQGDINATLHARHRSGRGRGTHQVRKISRGRSILEARWRCAVGGFRSVEGMASRAAMPLTDERWLPVVGWEGSYMVSDFGRIKSLRGHSKILAGSGNNGYRTVKLRDFPRKAHVGVHRLVLEAFVGPPPTAESEGCHDDGVKSNNCLRNLRWDTVAGNSADRWRHGTMHSRNLLADAQVVRIRTEAHVHDLTWAALFGVNRQVIRCARTGKTFPWVTTPALKRSCDRNYTLESTLGTGKTL